MNTKLLALGGLLLALLLIATADAYTDGPSTTTGTPVAVSGPQAIDDPYEAGYWELIVLPSTGTGPGRS